MSTATEGILPLHLLKANLELQLRVNRLLQETGHQWLDIASRASSEAIAESGAEIDDVLKAENWQALAALPAEVFWRQFQQRVGDAQAATQVAVGAQTAFAGGLQQAIQAWQKTAFEAVGGGAANGVVPFNDLFKPWGAAWAAAVPASRGRKARGD